MYIRTLIIIFHVKYKKFIASVQYEDFLFHIYYTTKDQSNGPYYKVDFSFISSIVYLALDNSHS